MSQVRSMTGYGASRFEHEGIDHVIELRSVNHRYMKVAFKFPVNLLPAQGELRRMLSGKLKRGMIDVFFRCGEFNGEAYTLNEEQLERYRTQLDRAGIDFTPQALLGLPGVASRAEVHFTDELKQSLVESFARAVDELVESRLKEGKALADDVLARCETCGDILDRIGERAPAVPEEYQKRLKEKLSELLNNSSLDESDPSFTREVAIMAEKADITEELVRFRQHIERFREVLVGEGPHGKECDFIIQEMNREVNTMGSKCSDYAISGDVIKLKTEIEKIREQVQNIE
ncbi:MAG: YicC/YloC family endoribonuclease [Planctomycetota bacterium]|nr:YicC/YloC family endoribonuclease [Planctomycetota bacterium]